jgi:hypothetical protein
MELASHRYHFHWPAVGTGIRLSIFVVLLSLFSLPSVLGQTPAKRIKKNTPDRLQSRFGLNHRQLSELSPFIQLEVKRLQTAYIAYNDQDTDDFMLAWREPEIWLKLMSNRRDIESGMKDTFSKPQANAMRAACSKMEGEMLTLLLEDQVDLLSAELELGAEQSDKVNWILSKNNSKKQRILANASQTNLRSFRQDIEAVTEEAEFEMAEVLTPEQQRDYDRLIEKRDRKRSRISLVRRTPPLIRFG